MLRLFYSKVKCSSTNVKQECKYKNTMDEVLGIDAMPFKVTPRMMLEIAYWAVKFCSYQETEDYFREK